VAVRLTNCGHTIGPDCFEEYLDLSLKSGQIPIKCPIFECQEHVNEADVRQYSPEYLELFHSQSLIAYRVVGNLQQCYNPSCDFFFELESPATQFVCPKCYIVNCINCQTTEHFKMTCEEYQSYEEEDDRFFETASEHRFKQCPKCLFWIEKNQGCNHMTCRCKFQFCYVCGGVWNKCVCSGYVNSVVFMRQGLFLTPPEIVKERRGCVGQWMMYTYHRPVKTLADFFSEDW
jgi:ariadne-1